MNKKDVNKDLYCPLNFERSSMAIPVSDITNTVNTYKVFDDERNSTTKFRLNVTLNPIMTNILANKTTEIIPLNGNVALSGQDRLDAIQKIDDTVYNYRIGFDIFNNNFTRINTFKTGNTLNDFIGVGLFDLLTIQESIKDNIFYDNGWICTSNKTKINNNKMFPSKKPCEKIDLFPTRDYFLFKPLYVDNAYGGELKDNWDVSLTYPFENYTDNILVTSKTGINGIPISDSSLITYNQTTYLSIKTVYKHGLNINDVIKIKRNDLNSDKTYLVYDIGDINKDNENFIFLLDTSKYSDLLSITDLSESRIVRVVNKTDSDYYIRKFRKLPNFTDDSEKITENNILQKILTGSTEFAKETYQPGFARNIFNDSIYQIQYIDDIDTNLIKDNLGRPLTEIFLTLIKKNIIDGNYEPANVFTKVTSGFDELPGVTGYSNVRMINNVTNTESPLEVNITTTGSTLYDGLIQQNNVFIGDIVEYNKSTVKEVVLDDIKHRFSTIQRESSNYFIYSDIFGDTTNMVLNSGFLEGTKYWGIDSPYHQISNLSVPTTGSTNALVILTDNSKDSGTWTSNNNNLKFESGRTYTVSFWMRSSDSEFTLDKVGIEGITPYHSFNITTSWQEFKFSFIATDYKSHSLIFYKSAGTPVLYGLTNVKIEQNPTGISGSTGWSPNPNDDNGSYVMSNKTIVMDPLKEGYFYKPHYKIQLKNYSAILNEGELPEILNCGDFISGMTYGNQIVLLAGQNDNNIKSLILKLNSLSGYTNSDLIRITKKSDLSYINLSINTSPNLNNCIIFNYDKNFMPGVSGITIDNYTIRKYGDIRIPLYAQDQYNGNCSWREILKEGVFDQESIKTTESTFTNGRLYIANMFNFYLKRQDPFGDYGLINNVFPNDVYGTYINNIISNNKAGNNKVSDNKVRKINTVC
jgi:hypothetical protein